MSNSKKRYLLDTQRYISKRRDEEIPSKTINEELRLLKAFFNDLVDKGIISKSPAEKIVRVTYEEPEALYFTKDMLRKSLEDGICPYDGALSLLADTGLRIGEFLDLSRTKDVDYTDEKIIVRRKKDWKPETRKGLLSIC